MTYKIAKTDRVDKVLEADKICFPQDAPPKVDSAIWWGAFCGEELVGYAGLRICRSPQNRGLAFLSRAGVLPEHRGNGLQKRLIRARERTARSIGMTDLVTYTVKWNIPSANSLIACGFRLYRPAYCWGGKDSLYWNKPL